MFTTSSRCALLILFLVTTAASQDLDTCTISGSVLDQTGAPVVKAEVSATLLSTTAVRKLSTNNSGTFNFIQLAPGLYSVTVRADGFASQSRQLSLLASQNVKLNFVVEIASIVVDPVVVTATGSSTIDTSRTTVGGTITDRELESLPIFSRSPLDLIFTLPGVTEEALSTRDLAEDRNVTYAKTPEEAGSFSLSGAPAYSNNITIDGLDNNDDRSARERFTPSVDAVSEVQVITNQFAAEYGRASGGRVNLRTKSGAKNYHGRGTYFFRDESLNANTVRNSSLGLKRLPLQEHNPAFVLSGPVPGLKRTFFFGSYELGAILDHALIDTLVPLQQSDLFRLPPPTHPEASRLEDVNAPALATQVAPFVQSISSPSKDHRITLRFDGELSEMHNVNVVLNVGRLWDLRQFAGANRLPQTAQPQIRNSESVAYADDWVLSARFVNQARFQFSRLMPAVKALTAGPVVLIALNDPQRSGTLVAGNSTASSSQRKETRFQFQNIFSAVVGPHSFKSGLDMQKISSTFIDLADSSGTFDFASAGDFLAGIPSRFRQNFLTESVQRNTYVGLFIQDQWQIAQHASLSFGLRYEWETIVHDLNNFGPRLAVAYDPFGDGKTVVRAGAGLFYSRALLRTIDDFTLGQQRIFFDTSALHDPITGRILTIAERRQFIAQNLHFPETLRRDSELVKQYALPNSNFSRRLDPALRIPESYQTNAGIERHLGGGFVVEANYSFSRGLHLWREFNANAPVLPAGFHNFTNYLTSRDFANFRSGTGTRPLYNASSAGELIRFALRSADPANPNAIVRLSEFGLPISVFSLNSLSSGTPVDVALSVLNNLRPNPDETEIEQLIAAGNSSYHGLSIEIRQRHLQSKFLRASFRLAYTFSKLLDDGVVNTSDALRPGDFRAERARSLLDRRHRLLFAGTFDAPAFLGGVRLAPVVRIASNAPFNISIGGSDRNLDDVSNDRPNFHGDIRSLRWRRPGEPLSIAVVQQFALPTIGQSGNLPRNAGTGPGTFLFDLNVAREFPISERLRLQPMIEFDNVLNKTVFAFGSEFINFNALSPTATEDQRLAFLNSFLVPTRTLRQRQIRVGLKVDF